MSSIIIGLFGGILGLGLGYLVIENRQVILDLFASWGFNPFPSEFNGFDGLPADIQMMEFIGVFSFAALFAWHLAFISDLRLVPLVEIQSLWMGLVLSPLQLLPLAAYLVLADRVRAEY